MNIELSVIGVVLGPSAKIRGWTNYWDDPVHVRKALLVGLGLVAFVVFMVAYERFDSHRRKLKRLERAENESDYPDSSMPPPR